MRSTQEVKHKILHRKISGTASTHPITFNLIDSPIKLLMSSFMIHHDVFTMVNTISKTTSIISNILNGSADLYIDSCSSMGIKKSEGC